MPDQNQKKKNPNNFSKGYPISKIDLQQYVCCGGPLLCHFFLVKMFQNHFLLSYSFPLLKLFSFYFLSSILWQFSTCLVSKIIGCLIKATLPPKKQHSNNFSRGQPMSSIDLQLYVCCGGPLLCQVFFEYFSRILLSFPVPFLQLLYLTF